jgi:hypothetical protein
MSESIQELILDELRGLRTQVSQSAERLARVETHVESMVGNTQPGRLTLLENKVSDIQRWRWTTTGIYMGVSGFISALTAFIYHRWK